MPDKQRTATQIAVEMSEVRSELNELVKGPAEGQTEAQHKEARDKAVNRLAELEPEYRAALVLEKSATEKENRAWQELRPGVTLQDYLKAAADEAPKLEGRAAELNEEMGLRVDGTVIDLPLRMLDPDPQAEHRAAIDPSGTANLDAYTGEPRRWLDRILRPTQAARLGITFDTVGVGEPVYPISTTGTASHQVGRGDAIAESNFAFTLTKMSPKRYGSRYRVRYEDLRTVAGFEAAIRRDLEMVMGLHVDSGIFKGQNPAGDDTDITGLDTAAGVRDIATSSEGNAQAKLAAAQKVMELYKTIAGMVDGNRLTATRTARLVLTHQLAQVYAATPMGAEGSDASLMTMEDWLRGRIDYGVYPSLGPAIAAGSLLGIGSLPRGLPGAAVAAMWPSVALIRDPYSAAAEGEVVITMQGMWDFAIIRPDQFFKVSAAA